MDRRLVAVCLLVVAVGGGVWAVGWSSTEQSTAYTVEVVTADTAEPTNVTAFGNLTDAQKDQFLATRNTRRSYDSRPVLAAYAGEYIRYDGEIYSVLVAVA